MIERVIRLVVNPLVFSVIGLLAFGWAVPQPASAQGQPAGWNETYSREVFRPVDEAYSWDSIQAMVQIIRDEGHQIPSGHPRIFITPANRTILANAIAVHHATFMQQAVDLADQYYGVVINDPGGHSNEPDAQPVIIACGIIYQLGQIPGVSYSHTPLEYGQSGVAHLVHMAQMDTYYEHRTFLGMPLGYDWLFDLMTAQQREIVATTMMSYVPLDDPHINPYNNMPGVRLMGPLAILGDGIDDAGAQDGIDMFYGGLVLGEPSNFGMAGLGSSSNVNVASLHMWVPEGPGPEGLGYSMWNAPFYFFLEAWYDQTGEDYFKLPFFQSWPFYYSHAEGNAYEREDKYARLQDRPWMHGAYGVNQLLEPALARSNQEAASLAKWHHFETSQHYADGSTTPGMFYMLRADPSVVARSPIELGVPTTANVRMINHLFARNSWEGVDSTWIYFEAPTWNGTRNAGPVNDLNIWKNGGFLLCKRAMSHDYDGGNRTNTMNIYDFGNYPGVTLIPENVMDRSWNRDMDIDYPTTMGDITKDVKGYMEGMRYVDELEGEYLYAFGDGERSIVRVVNYELHYPLDNWDRQFVWFRTAHNDDTDHFVVYDRVDKVGGHVTEHIQFNFNMEPDIRDRATNGDLGDGLMLMPGIYLYEGADRMVATNTVATAFGTAHGRAFIDTLLPPDPVYYRMGGLEHRTIDLFGNDPGPGSGSPDDPQNILDGMWRVQITSAGNPVRLNYLHTIQAGEDFVNTPEASELIEGSTVVGARTGGNIALFAAGLPPVAGGSVIPPAGTFRVLICDLNPDDEYIVSAPDPLTLTANAAGVIFLAEASFDGLTPLSFQTIYEEIFSDGFESGSCDAWSGAIGCSP